MRCSVCDCDDVAVGSPLTVSPCGDAALCVYCADWLAKVLEARRNEQDTQSK